MEVRDRVITILLASETPVLPISLALRILAARSRSFRLEMGRVLSRRKSYMY